MGIQQSPCQIALRLIYIDELCRQNHWQCHTTKIPALLALAMWGKATQIKMILMIQRLAFSRSKTADGFADKLHQWSYSLYDSLLKL